jgi:serine/threonine protein kinase
MAVTSSCKTEGMHITGSVPWAAPEVVTQTSYGRRSDIWSFGCTVLELATGRQPWHEAALDNPCAFIVKIGLSTDIPLIPDTLSPPLADFIRICLNRDKHARPHASDLLRHPFIVGVHSV